MHTKQLQKRSYVEKEWRGHRRSWRRRGIEGNNVKRVFIYEILNKIKLKIYNLWVNQVFYLKIFFVILTWSNSIDTLGPGF